MRDRGRGRGRNRFDSKPLERYRFIEECQEKKACPPLDPP